MAVLFPGDMRVTTSAGLPVSGGKCRVRLPNTTTLASLYSDEAMATPLTNPVAADANGWLVAIHCAESTYDIAMLTAGDVLLPGQIWEDWPTFAGGSASTIERDVAGARVLIDGGDIGDGSIGVRYNNGNPDPDDTGGYFRIAGWDGTSADKGIIDATAVDFTQAKSIQEAGKRLPAVLYTEPTASAAASTVIIALPNSPTGTRAWRVTLYDVVFSSTTTTTTLQFSQDNGATYAAGANDYAFGYISSAASNPVYTGDDTFTAIGVGPNPSGASANHRSHIVFDVITPNSGAQDTLVTRGTWTGIVGSALGMGIVQFEGALRNGLGRVTHARISVSAGTIACSYHVEALRGFGE